MSEESPTPLLDQLDRGPWPSFVRELKRRLHHPAVRDLLSQLERSYRDKVSHWKPGGLVTVKGYGGGITGRYHALPEEYPEAAEFHTIRINPPAGFFYDSETLRKLCDIWERHGSGLTNFHGSTGDILFLGCRSSEVEATFAALTEAGFDLGGSGAALRTPSCCVGMARCEWACFDTMGLTYELTQIFQDELHRPSLPHKFKIKASGCPNDCVAAIARADLSIIGTWRDGIRIDEAALAGYVDGGEIDITRDVVERCPTRCMTFEKGRLQIDNESCVRCMHCISALPKALRPGLDRGAAILIGGKAPLLTGAILSSVLVPFMKLEPPYEALVELVRAIWDAWADNGRNRERVGEYIKRVGLPTFLEQVGMEPLPEMVAAPRSSPFIRYDRA